MNTHETLLKAVRGDTVSVDIVLKQYTPLVHKIVQKYCWMAPSHSREDLFQEGLIGVAKAIKTFEPSRGNCFMTWVYPNVRGAVQSAARREKRHPRYILPIEKSDWGNNLEDEKRFEPRTELSCDTVKRLILEGCGSLTSKRAEMICDRYGLLGKEPLRQGEVAKKYGMSKQAVQSHMARFHKKIRENHPELKDFI